MIYHFEIKNKSIMKTFEINFNGKSDDDKNYGCGMTISGSPEIIGRMFAEYAMYESKHGHYEPMRLLFAAFENLRKNSAGSIVGSGGIVSDFPYVK
jgi:hypothetical protein